eukprot:4302587-Prymnesium_polylepis.1
MTRGEGGAPRERSWCGLRWKRSTTPARRPIEHLTRRPVATPKGGDQSEGAAGRQERRAHQAAAGAGEPLSGVCGRERGLQEGTAGPVDSSS